MSSAIIEIKHLKKSYGQNEVLKDISLSVNKGDFDYRVIRVRKINLPSLY